MFKSVWTYVIGSIASLWIFFRSLFLIKLQLSSYMSVFLLEEIKKNGKALVFEQEYVNHRTPNLYRGLVLYKGCLFSLNFSTENKSDEGFSAFITCLRWQTERILPKFTNTFNFNVSKNGVGIYIVEEWSCTKVGNIDTSAEIIPYLENSVYEPLEKDINFVLEGKRKKIGSLLYGKPGNGKSYLIRYFAIKYKLPIYIFVLERELRNRTVIKMFNNLSGPGIVLFEDFDCYFKERGSLLEKADFTFDTIINGIDGLYCDTKGLIYFLTTNNLENVDISLKERPSRFKYVIPINNPSELIRNRIFNDSEIVRKTNGLTLDECLKEKEILDSILENKGELNG